MLENSVEHFHDIDEESLEGDMNSSIEEVKADEVVNKPNEKINKKQK